MSPDPSVLSEVVGSTSVSAEPSKNRVQISLPLASSLRRPIGSGAFESAMSATVFPKGSVAIVTTPAEDFPLPTVATQPDAAGALFTVPSNAAPISRSEWTETSQVVAVPAQAPLQLENVEPCAGVAFRTTLIPSSNGAAQ